MYRDTYRYKPGCEQRVFKVFEYFCTSSLKGFAYVLNFCTCLHAVCCSGTGVVRSSSLSLPIQLCDCLRIYFLSFNSERFTTPSLPSLVSVSGGAYSVLSRCSLWLSFCHSFWTISSALSAILNAYGYCLPILWNSVSGLGGYSLGGGFVL